MKLVINLKKMLIYITVQIQKLNILKTVCKITLHILVNSLPYQKQQLNTLSKLALICQFNTFKDMHMISNIFQSQIINYRKSFYQMIIMHSLKLLSGHVNFNYDQFYGKLTYFLHIFNIFGVYIRISKIITLVKRHYFFLYIQLLYQNFALRKKSEEVYLILNFKMKK